MRNRQFGLQGRDRIARDVRIGALIDGRQPVRPMAPAHRRFTVGYIWNVNAPRPLSHGRPSRTRFAISLHGLLVRLPISGTAVEVEQHARTELGGVKRAQSDLNADVLLDAAERCILARGRFVGGSFERTCGRCGRILEELRHFDG